MNKRGRQVEATAAKRGFKLILIPFMIFIVLTALTLNALADPTNETTDDTWHDTHWGGDTGEEEYREPTRTEIEEEEKKGGLCGLSFMMIGVCIPAAAICYQKKRRIQKDE